MLRPGFLSLVLTSLLISATAQAQPLLPTQEIGTQGAVITSDGWNRVKLTENIGKDQFQHQGKENYLFVFESYAVLDRRVDFEREIEMTLDRVSGRMSDTQVDPEMVFERLDAFTRATRRFTGNVNGMELGYQLDLISAGDGLAYVFLSWTGKSKFEAHWVLIDSLIETLRLPGEGTEHFTRSQVTPHVFDFGPYKVELSFQDSIFAPREDSKPGERYSFNGDEEELAVHLFVIEIEGDIEEALDAVRTAVVKESTVEELLRAELETPAGRGRQLLLRKSDGDESLEVAIAVIEIDPHRYIDLRMVTSAAIGHREELWQRLLTTLAVKREAKVEAFPVGKTPVPAKTFPGDAARQLIEGSRYLAPLSWIAPTPLPDGGFLNWSGSQLLRYGTGPDADKPEVLVEVEGANASGFLWGQEVYVHFAETKEVRKVVEGNLEKALFQAELVVVAGEDLLCVRSPEPKSLFGMHEFQTVGTSVVVLRRPQGEERRILEIPALRVSFMAARDGQALVAARPRRPSHGTPATELHLIDLKSGRSRQLESWIRVSNIAAGDDGFLISGTPDSGVEGVYLHSGDGSRELLISGDGLGISQKGQDFVFVSDLCPDEESFRCAYLAPLELVRRHGPGYWPWGVKVFNEIAAAAALQVEGRDQLLPMPITREQVTAFLAAAQEEAKKRTGWPLPSSMAGVDRLFDLIASDGDLSPHGGALLTSLVVGVLLDAGAEWVPAEGPGPFGLHRQVQPDHAFAMLIHLPTLIRFAGSEEGWYSPISSLLELAEGRLIVVGVDGAALDRRLRKAVQVDLEGLLAKAPEKQIQALLAAHPGNTNLRKEVYDLLGAFGRFELLGKVAASFAATAEAKTFDVVAAGAAQLSGKLSPSEVDALIAALRAAIEKDPEQAGLYLVLGAAYEKTTMPDRVLYARACYQKAQELVSWGRQGEDAKAALARLEEVQP